MVGGQLKKKKHLTLMSSKFETMIWLHNDTGQGIPNFDSCQLIITWISNDNGTPLLFLKAFNGLGVYGYTDAWMYRHIDVWTYRCT